MRRAPTIGVLVNRDALRANRREPPSEDGAMCSESTWPAVCSKIPKASRSWSQSTLFAFGHGLRQGALGLRIAPITGPVPDPLVDRSTCIDIVRHLSIFIPEIAISECFNGFRLSPRHEADTLFPCRPIRFHTVAGRHPATEIVPVTEIVNASTQPGNPSAPRRPACRT